MIKLYDYILSSDCYKARLLLSMLGLQYTPVKIDVHPGREHRSPEFLTLNPLGEIPVLEDDHQIIWKSSAILVYLAKRYDPTGKWLPDDPVRNAQTAEWLAFSEHELATISRLRMAAITARGMATEDDLRAARRALEVLEDHLAEGELTGRRWLLGEEPTIADISVFPCAALAQDAELSLSPCPALWRWINRFKELGGFIVMPGVLPNFAGAF